jgi:hypothetical protein
MVASHIILNDSRLVMCVDDPQINFDDLSPWLVQMGRFIGTTLTSNEILASCERVITFR